MRRPSFATSTVTIWPGKRLQRSGTIVLAHAVSSEKYSKDQNAIRTSSAAPSTNKTALKSLLEHSFATSFHIACSLAARPSVIALPSEFVSHAFAPPVIGGV
jgi:hypothetical protein